MYLTTRTAAKKVGILSREKHALQQLHSKKGAELILKVGLFLEITVKQFRLNRVNIIIRLIVTVSKYDRVYYI